MLRNPTDIGAGSALIGKKTGHKNNKADCMDREIAEHSLGGFDSFETRLGDELRGERATLGKSLLDVQRDIRIKASYISAIENCDLSVFPNPSFVAGYVRSYARYLHLDPEQTYHRFCLEAGYQSASAELNTPSAQASEVGLRDDHPASGWVPRMPGMATQAKASNAGATLMAAGPLLALMLVIGGLAYGAWFLINDIQRVEFAPIENNPMVAFEPQGLGAGTTADGFTPSSIELAADPSILYNRRELDVPVVEPRDGPIFAINPDETGDTVIPGENETEGTLLAEAELPIVSETPEIPTISVVAQEEVWVRIYEENGTIIFEKTLAAGEQYQLPEDAPAAYLRAGNATALFVMVNDAAYGPVSNTDAVVRDIPLAPTEVASAMAVVDNPSVALQVAADAWREIHTASND